MRPVTTSEHLRPRVLALPATARRTTASAPALRVLLVQTLLVLILGWAAGARAQVGLNEALVPVDSDSAQARIAAFPRALDQVFTKLSGRSPARSSPEREAELAGAALLAQRYRYRTSASGEPTHLWVSFDEQALSESASRAGVKPWPQPRPAPLLWVALRSAAGADMVAPASEDGLDRVLLDAAWRRGVPLRLPLMDLEDRMRVQPEGVRAADAKMLITASERYPASGPVVGVSVEQGAEARWDATWLMLDAGRRRVRWRSQGATPGQALDAGVDALVELLVARDAVVDPTSDKTPPAAPASEEAPPSASSEPGDRSVNEPRPARSSSDRIEIAVHGVARGGDYGRLMDYLRKLEGVTRFTMLPKEGELARFRMDIPGGEDAFRRTIARDDIIEPDGDDSEYRMKR